MQSNLNIAWGIAADGVQLGARLETYVKTKAAITTFRLCLLHTDSKSMSNLPPEMVHSIIENLKDMVYRREMQKWLLTKRCISDQCRPGDHLDLCETDESLIRDGCIYQMDLNDYSSTGIEAIHVERATSWLETIIPKGPPHESKVRKEFKICKMVSQVRNDE